ncbi:unnamed protein product, partial [Staurois parvus]
SAAPFVYRPAFTYSAPVTKTRKKAKILSNQYHPASIHSVSLPSENPPSVVQPGASAPAIQPDVSTQPMPAVVPDDPMPAVEPDDLMPARRSNA